MKKRLSFIIIALCLAFSLFVPSSVLAVPKISLPELAPDNQVTEAELVYQANCAGCHGDTAQGGFGPAIAGQSAAEITAALSSVAAMSSVNVTTVEIDQIASFLQAMAAPQITLLQPVSGQFAPGTQNPIEVSISSATSTIVSAEFQTWFNDSPGTPTAIEVFVQTPLSIPAPLMGAGAVADTTPTPAAALATSVVSVVVTGTVTAVNPATGEWQIGIQPVFVYESTDTAFLGIPVPQVGDAVRVDAVRALAAGPLVATEIARLAGGTLPAPAATKDVSLLFNGTVGSIQPPEQSAGIRLGGERWTVGGVQFLIADANFPATIGPGLDVGSAVTVRYRPLPSVTAGNTALEISSPQRSDVISQPLPPDPVSNTDVSPENLPAGSLSQFVIGGVVSAVNSDGEWQIGNPPVTVYESANTTVSAPAPIAGDEVLVTGRSPGAGPIVADSIVRLTPGPLAAVPPVVEKTFLFNGTVGATSPTSWTIDGVSFVVDDPQTPAVIGAGTGVGSEVTVEFRVNLPPAPDNDLWSPFDLPFNQNSTTTTGTANLTPPAVTSARTGFIYLRATNADQQVTTVAIPATLGAVAPPPPPPPPGGGGDGGGPITTAVNLNGLSGTLGVNSTGVVQSTTTLTSEDGRVTLNIPAGTVLKTAAGGPLISMTVSVPDSIPAPPSGKTVILALDFGPDGATFDPPITLTLTYEESELPAGVSEASLSLAFWDDSGWAVLESEVDAGADTVSAPVSHFTTFAILAQQPPTLSITTSQDGATLSSGNVTVTADLTNFVLVPPGGDPVPGEGHLHYYLDMEIPTAPGQPAVTGEGTYKVTPGVSVTWENITPGEHTFGVQLVNNNHTPLEPPVTATVTVTVEPPPTPAPTPTPERTPTPTPTPTPAPESAPAPSPEAPLTGTNWGVIFGIIAAVIVVAGLAVFMVRRRQTG